MSSFTAALEKEVSVKQLEKKNSAITFKVTADKELVNKCFHNALLQVQAKAQIQGFRTGKVPLDIVKKNFTGHIMERAADLVIRNASGAALDKTKVKAVMMPSVSKVDFTALKENTDFSFEMTVEVAPEFKVTGYTGIEVNQKTVNITDEDVKKHIDEILEHNANLVAQGDDAVVEADSFAVVKYTGSKDGKEDKKYASDGELVDMSAPQTIAGLADAIKGAKKGEARQFEANIDDGAIKFNVTVEEIKRKNIPALDEAFAKEMGFDSVEKLKATVKEGMEKEAKLAAEREVSKQIEDALVKANSFDLPAGLVDYHTGLSVENFINRMLGGKQDLPEENRKAFAEKMRPNVERDLKIGYITHAIAEAEKLEATDADWQAEMDKSLQTQAKSKEDTDKIKKFFESRKEDVKATISERKVFDFLKAKAKIKEVK